MRNLMISITALALLAGAPALSKPDDKYEDRQDRREDRKDRREDGRDMQQSRDRLQDERQDVREAQRFGNRNDVAQEKFDVQRARKAYQQDARDWKRSQKRARQEQRADARYWQQGRSYDWNRPDPRHNGYFAENYYRAGNYRPYQLQSDDRIFRGNDNRYYCRRGDGTTGLIIGAIGGGVLGNVIAPGGSKTLGSIIGGSLGAVLGNVIGRGDITCR